MANPARRSKPTRQHDQPPVGPTTSVVMGAACDQNARRRRRMEDAHAMHPDLPAGGGQRFTFMAVFDGHGGGTAAEWCGSSAHVYLQEELGGLGGLGDGGVSGGAGRRREVEACLDRAFRRCDAAILSDPNISSGCTVAVCLIDWLEHRVYSANCGDARTVLCRAGKAVRLSFDHKGSDAIEQKRVLELGGFISNDRVSGMLAITRSFGDAEMKDVVSGRPYCASLQLQSPSDAMLIVACDGLWDVVGDQEACELASAVVSANEGDPRRAVLAADALVTRALDLGTFDNVSVVVCLL